MSRAPDKPRAVIVTQDPYNQGGVRAIMTGIYRMIEKWDVRPELMYTLSDPPLPGKRSLLGLRGQHVERLGMQAFVMPSFPLPFWLWVLTPLIFGWRALDRYEMVFAACGSSHMALLPAVKGRPYIIWLATIYEDELRSKIESGDAWARRVLNSPTWPVVKAQERLVLRRASRILALSQYTANRIKAVLPEVSERIEVMCFPIDTGRYHPDPDVRQNSPYGDYLLLSARLNDPRKNVGMLLQAFKIVRQKMPHLKLVLAGDEPNEELQAQVGELELQDAVVFTGFLPGTGDLIRLYQGARLFVLPSLQEGLGIVVLEAMACGTPVVSTRCGGPEEIINDGTTGRLTPVGDVQAFAGAILDLLGGPERLEKMRQECVAVITEQFSQQVIEKQLARVAAQVFPGQQSYIMGER